MTEMRAAQLKEDLLALVALGNHRASLILAEVPPGDLRRIVRASTFDWLPIGVNLELCRTVHDAAGDAGSRAWGRAALRRTIESSLFRPVVNTAIRAFGLAPVTLLRLAPLVWRSTFRDAGRLTVTRTSPHTATVRLVGLPEPMRERPFLLSIAGALEAALDIAGGLGTVELVEPPDGEPRYVAIWPARSRAP
jgi:hypothetical protein